MSTQNKTISKNDIDWLLNQLLYAIDSDQISKEQIQEVISNKKNNYKTDKVLKLKELLLAKKDFLKETNTLLIDNIAFFENLEYEIPDFPLNDKVEKVNILNLVLGDLKEINLEYTKMESNLNQLKQTFNKVLEIENNESEIEEDEIEEEIKEDEIEKSTNNQEELAVGKVTNEENINNLNEIKTNEKDWENPIDNLDIDIDLTDDVIKESNKEELLEIDWFDLDDGLNTLTENETTKKKDPLDTNDLELNIDENSETKDTDNLELNIDESSEAKNINDLELNIDENSKTKDTDNLELNIDENSETKDINDLELNIDEVETKFEKVEDSELEITEETIDGKAKEKNLVDNDLDIDSLLNEQPKTEDKIKSKEPLPAINDDWFNKEGQELNSNKENKNWILEEKWMFG